MLGPLITDLTATLKEIEDSLADLGGYGPLLPRVVISLAEEEAKNE